MMNLVWSNLHIARKRELISAGKPNSGSMFALLTLSIFLWQNSRFGSRTIVQGSISFLNFQNGHFSPQTILLDSISL
jgi:hypothetical protein